MPPMSKTVAPTSSWTQSLPGIVDRLGLELDPAHPLGLGPIDDALELDDPAVLERPGRFHREGAPRRGQHRAGVEPLGQVGPQLDDDLAAQAVGLGDPADLWRRSVVDDVHAGLDAVLGAGHVDQSADGLGRPAPAPDHPSHVIGCHVQAEAQAAAPLLGVDDHRVGLVGERAGQVAEHGQRVPPSRASLGSLPSLPSSSWPRSSEALMSDVVRRRTIDVGLLVTVDGVDVAGLVEVGHFDLAAANSSHAPEVFNSFSTRSVGCAPLTNHFTAFSLSILITASGSAVEAPRGAYVPTISRNRPSRGDRLSAATTR